VGAKKPMRLPRFIARLFAGEPGVVMMTELRWRPRHPSWRQGFAAA